MNRMPFQYLNAVHRVHNGTEFVMTAICEIGNEIVGSAVGFPSTWDGLRKAMHSMLADSMAGLPFTGSEVCGNDTELIDEELCVRW